MIMSPVASSIIRNSFSCSSHMNSCLEHLVVSRGEKKKWVSTKVSHPVLENKITFLIHKQESGPGFNHLKMKRVVVCWQTGGKIHEACFGLQLSVTTYQHMWISTSVCFAPSRFRRFSGLWLVWDLHAIVWLLLLLLCCFNFTFSVWLLSWVDIFIIFTRSRSCFSSLSLLYSKVSLFIAIASVFLAVYQALRKRM